MPREGLMAHLAQLKSFLQSHLEAAFAKTVLTPHLGSKVNNLRRKARPLCLHSAFCLLYSGLPGDLFR